MGRTDPDGETRKIQALWLAYLGWLVAIAMIAALKHLGYSDIGMDQLIILFGAATVAHLVACLALHRRWDRLLSFDPHFVLVPNWLLFAPVAAYGYYAVGTARDLMLVGWLMGLFFLGGRVRFRGVLLTAVWYMVLYLAFLSLASRDQPVDMGREVIRAVAFLAVCVFLALLLDRFAAQTQHLKASLAQLRDKDREITRLNQRLSLFVSDPLVEHLNRDNGDAVLRHQRRKITVFFSDICRFSTLTDAMEPEEMAQQLNEYFDAMIRITFDHGGTVDKLLGDGMMVIFGAPTDMDPAEGAYRCTAMALAMRRELGELNRRWQRQGYPYSFQVRMGMHTGVCVLGSFGSARWLNYTAMGSQVNIAARLQEKAEPGQIVMSHATYALIAEKVSAQELGELHLKGIHYPIKAYLLEGIGKDSADQRLTHRGPGFELIVQPKLLDGEARKRLIDFIRRCGTGGSEDGPPEPAGSWKTSDKS
ncbi:Adenylate cyclase, class 3 [Desulfacinum hydrothermale DSM 13146]|uniref:Adenylate cyclase, class 3 n=1 Tax=Desulfacinum hydrothermale DSM 13146 TaxID=1121390 RepID=A0A1W1XAP5_9BACT|nr:adenylate/guanylate cyclase domain-containing protein [Desulfacinum hydrothermale]SMC20917.1 Adenylate cyclase, class 3 [Desulfacinum hydrothermale DSM 13146]